MRIERIEEKKGLVLVLHGRLDAGHCRPLEDELEDALRQGAHRIALDMDDVLFLSSAGIRSLLRYQKILTGIGGELVIFRPSSFVRDILDMVGMTALFVTGTVKTDAGESASDLLGEGTARYDFPTSEGFRWDIPVPGAPRSFSAGVWGLGIGSFESVPDSLGEILAAEGHALMLPPGDGGAPDFMTATGAFVPVVHFASGLVLQGDPSLCLRFSGPLPGFPLSQLAQGALAAVGSSAAAVALVAETSGLVGASLRHPSVLDETLGAEDASVWQRRAEQLLREDFFAFPAVREHLAFRPEKRYDRHLAVVLGVAAAVPGKRLKTQLRPLGSEKSLWGHFHCAVFPFRAIPQGRVTLDAVLGKIFDASAPVGLLHLLQDHRPISGAGESAFLSGALWAGPLMDPEGGRA